MKKTVCLILAAGQGKRMHSALPKVLHEVCGRPMLWYLIQAAKSLGAARIITVIGHGGSDVERYFGDLSEFVWQKNRLGTADAVARCKPLLKNFDGDVVVLAGDAPLICHKTIEQLLRHHRQSNAQATVLSAKVGNPQGYGRIVRDAAGCFESIREDKDATPEELAINEVNTGVYAFDWPCLSKFLVQIRADNSQKEFYLTDAPVLMRRSDLCVEIVETTNADECVGINARAELSRANQIMNKKLLEDLSSKGVTVIDPATTFIEQGVRVGVDTVIYPFTYVEKGVTIGKMCSIGPFCKIRSGTTIHDHATVGSFVEVVRSEIGQHTNVKHLTYLGDAKVGNYVNVGAGTITANFNGRTKNKTVIGDGAFIGCDTVLVAPVKVGKMAKTGAGSVVPKGKNVKPGETVIGVPARPILKKGKTSHSK